jgi:outer membrane protein TolC
MLHPIAAVLAVAIQAQDPDTLRMSFAEALDRAHRENPGFVQQRLQSANADLSLSMSRAWRYYPRLDFDVTTPSYVSNLTTVRLADGSDIFVPVEKRTVAAGISLSQPLPTGGRLSIDGDLTALHQPLLATDARYTGITALGIRLDQEFFGVNRSVRDYRLAKESHARSRANFANQERSLARNVVSAYYGLVQARKQAELDSVLAVRDAERFAQVRERAATTRLSEVDSLKFELEAIRSSMSRTRSSQNLTRARQQLNELLALPVNTIVIPDTSIRVVPFVPDVARGIAEAYRRRQDLLLAEMSVDNRRAGLRDAHRTSPITVSLSSNLGFNGSHRSDALRLALSEAIDRQDRARTINLRVAVPLFDRFEERNAVARARNDLSAAEANLADERRQIESEVRQAGERVANAASQLDLAQRSVAITRRALEVQNRRFQLGEITSAELLIDQAAYRQAEITLIQAQIDFLTTTEDWKRAIGEDAFGKP